jgi:hypothetical protein
MSDIIVRSFHRQLKRICFGCGMLLEKQVDKLRIKIRLIEACDEKGIVAHRIKKIFQKEVVEMMQLGEEHWFDVNDWRDNDKP